MSASYSLEQYRPQRPPVGTPEMLWVADELKRLAQTIESLNLVINDMASRIDALESP